MCRLIVARSRRAWRRRRAWPPSGPARGMRSPAGQQQGSERVKREGPFPPVEGGCGRAPRLHDLIRRGLRPLVVRALRDQGDGPLQQPRVPYTRSLHEPSPLPLPRPAPLQALEAPGPSPVRRSCIASASSGPTCTTCPGHVTDVPPVLSAPPPPLSPAISASDVQSHCSDGRSSHCRRWKGGSRTVSASACSRGPVWEASRPAPLATGSVSRQAPRPPPAPPPPPPPPPSRRCRRCRR